MDGAVTVLLSVDWDAFSGTVEHVFDAPIWGTPDREHDRAGAWRARAAKRSGADTSSSDWAALDADFPLYPGWEALRAYAGRPAYSALSHADAAVWLRAHPGRDVLNLDSHHDLYSGSGDPQRWRPGNWAGLGLEAGLIRRYEARYPAWHSGLMVAEGYDLARTWDELRAHLPPALLERVTLTREGGPHGCALTAGVLDGWALPAPETVEALLLVQSPAWTSPAHDDALRSLLSDLRAQPITPLQPR